MSSSSATVCELVERAAATWPQRIYALDAEGRNPLTFGALAASCRQVAALLEAHGSKPGDTVSLVMPNGLMTLQLLLGAMHGGWCVNPVNLLSQPEQMRHVLGHSDCKLVFVSPEREGAVRAALEGIDRKVTLIVIEPDATSVASTMPPPSLSAVAVQAANQGSAQGVGPLPQGVGPGPQGEEPLPQGVEPFPQGVEPFPQGVEPFPVVEHGAALRRDASGAEHSVALLMYTSGTTGVPKGVMLTHANLAANAHAISAEHGLSAQDRVLAVLPLYHINAFAVTMLAPLAHGGSLALAPKFSAARFWQQAHARECTWLNVVPTMISYLLEGAVPPREQTSRLRFCRSASAALPVEHLRGFEAKFGIGVIETMGLTETAAPVFSNPLHRTQRKPGSVGRASGCEAQVVDTDLAAVADGQTGEITVRGPSVMPGYYKDEAATRAAFTPDGWLRSGDLGRRDVDGFFFVTGRIKELIIKGGENIAPREIDEVLLRHPAVLDAAAVGIADRHYGQDIMACVVLRDGHGADEAGLREFCVAQLGQYKTPKVFRFVAELPRGPSGKVQRLKLVQLAG